MSKKEKRLKRLLSKPTPKDMTWAEYCDCLNDFQFEKKSGGKGFKFIHPATELVLIRHSPHPEKHVKTIYIKDTVKKLIEKGIINE